MSKDKETVERVKKFYADREALITDSITPAVTEKADNQCDGCKRGLPIVNGLHRQENMLPYMACTKDRYKPNTTPTVDGEDYNTGIGQKVTAEFEVVEQPAESEKPTGKAPCKNHCEAQAFYIEIRSLRAEIKRLISPNTPTVDGDLVERVKAEGDTETDRNGRESYEYDIHGLHRIIALIESAVLDKAVIKDAERYRYIRDNQSWHRFDDCSLVGVKFKYDDIFTARPMLDYYIDEAINALRGDQK